MIDKHEIERLQELARTASSNERAAMADVLEALARADSVYGSNDLNALAMLIEAA